MLGCHKGSLELRGGRERLTKQMNSEKGLMHGISRRDLMD
jgi:hypothetical protein